MRIRNLREEDIPTLVHIERLAASTDGRPVREEAEMYAWLTDPALEAGANAFVITDDDDELNTWGQAGTLEGIEGEIVGYTVVQHYKDGTGYHFLCQGAVHPQFRRQNAGRALLICAMNRVRILSLEYDLEAEQEGLPLYFEALLPLNDPASSSLAKKCEMCPAAENAPTGLRLYRGTL